MAGERDDTITTVTAADGAGDAAELAGAPVLGGRWQIVGLVSTCSTRIALSCERHRRS